MPLYVTETNVRRLTFHDAYPTAPLDQIDQAVEEALRVMLREQLDAAPQVRLVFPFSPWFGNNEIGEEKDKDYLISLWRDPIDGQPPTPAAVVVQEYPNIEPYDPDAFGGGEGHAASLLTVAAEARLAVRPNPSRGAATVSFALSEAAEVHLALYDGLGREVAVLAEGPLPAGSHVVTLNAGAWPSGVYVVRLVAGERVETARLTLVR